MKEWDRSLAALVAYGNVMMQASIVGEMMRPSTRPASVWNGPSRISRSWRGCCGSVRRFWRIAWHRF